MTNKNYTIPDLEIIKDKKPPQPLNSNQGFYKKFFNSMDIGDWCVVKTEDVTRVRQQANTHLRGKYSMYKHPKEEEAGTYILAIVK